MSDETTNNGPEGDAPAPPPLRAVFMVWPGQVHGQTWMFLWLGVAYLIGSLLPWYGENSAEYVLEKPYQIQGPGENTPAKMTNVLSRVHYEMARDNHLNHNEADPGPIVDVRAPAKPFGQTIILLCAIAMVISGVMNIWNRRLTMTPTLCTWFIALAVLYFTTGSSYAVGETGYFREPNVVKGFTQMGDTLGAVFGNFALVIEGKTNAEMREVFSRFGMGYYMTMLSELFLLLFIALSIVGGMAKGKKDDGAPAASSGPASRRRPSSFGASGDADAKGDD